MDEESESDQRLKQVLVGAVILTFLAIVAAIVIVGCHYLPGVFGEWVAFMVGLVTTPIFLEISAFVVGLMVVLAINHWREKADGPELVYLEEELSEGKGSKPDE